MKFLLMISLSLISPNCFADQGEALAKGRDLLIDQSIGILKKYCGDLALRSSDAAYICRLQVEEDCSRISDKQKVACGALNKIKDLEKKISLSDKNIAQIEETPLYSSKPIIKTKENEEQKSEPAPSLPTLKQISVRRGSSSFNLKNPEAITVSQSIDRMISKINSMKVRTDCSSDNECKVQSYGVKICGGPMGTFVYSQRGEEYKAMEDEISKFNSADEAFIKEWNKDVLGTCDWNGRTEPAKCIDQHCS